MALDAGLLPGGLALMQMQTHTPTIWNAGDQAPVVRLQFSALANGSLDAPAKGQRLWIQLAVPR